MNVILIDDKDFKDNQTVWLTDRRAQHVVSVLKSNEGDTLAVGQLNGKLGLAQVQKIGARSVELCDIVLDKQPPKPLAVTLVLSMPRPLVFNRLLAAVTTLGVKRIVLLHSRRVEKSYWNSPVLNKDSIDQQLRLGLEQAVDTLVPQVVIRKRFKPFVEDELGELIADGEGWLAHPADNGTTPKKSTQPRTVIVGPEGGFIPYEVELFQQQGVKMLSLGERILRVESAVPIAIAAVGGMIK